MPLRFRSRATLSRATLSRATLLRAALLASLLAAAPAGCGARSQLWEPDPETDPETAPGTDSGQTCSQPRIGLLGNPGAYDEGEFQTWFHVSGAAVTRLLTTSAEPLTAATLQPFDVVVLDWLPRDYSPSEAALFAEWVQGGGGVVAMSGYDNVIADDWHANSLLAPLGVAYSGPLLNATITDLAPHPITAGLSSIAFEGGYAVSDLGGAASTRTPIAFFPDTGEDVAFAIEMGAGRAFVHGDEWIEFHSKGTFSPKLWLQIVTWVGPAAACPLDPPG